jgi:hypothetical protein
VAQSENADRIEKFTNHPLNGYFVGRERDNRQSFWKSAAQVKSVFDLPTWH